MGKPHNNFDRSLERELSQAQATLEAQLQGQDQARLAVQALNAESDRNLTYDHHTL
jgi:hypothetical protein